MKKGFTLIELLIVIAIITILALIAIPNFLEAQTRASVSRVQADMRSTATAIEAYFIDYNKYPMATYFWDHTYFVYNTLQPCSTGVKVHGFCYNTSLMWFTGLTTPMAYMTQLPYQDPLRGTRLIVDWCSGPGGGAGAPALWPHIQFANYAGAAEYAANCQNFWNGTGGAWATCPPTEYATKMGALAPLKFNSTDPEFSSGNLLTKNWGKSGSRAYPTGWSLQSAGPDRTFTEYRNSALNTTVITSDAPRIGGTMGCLLTGETNFYDPSNGTNSRGNIWRFAASQDK